nr:hypothetical protein [Rhodococcus qingshengii]
MSNPRPARRSEQVLGNNLYEFGICSAAFLFVASARPRINAPAVETLHPVAHCAATAQLLGDNGHHATARSRLTSSAPYSSAHVGQTLLPPPPEPLPALPNTSDTPHKAVDIAPSTIEDIKLELRT